MKDQTHNDMPTFQWNLPRAGDVSTAPQQLRVCRLENPSNANFSQARGRLLILSVQLHDLRVARQCSVLLWRWLFLRCAKPLCACANSRNSFAWCRNDVIKRMLERLRIAAWNEEFIIFRILNRYFKLMKLFVCHKTAAGWQLKQAPMARRSQPTLHVDQWVDHCFPPHCWPEDRCGPSLLYCQGQDCPRKGQYSGAARGSVQLWARRCFSQYRSGLCFEAAQIRVLVCLCVCLYVYASASQKVCEWLFTWQ